MTDTRTPVAAGPPVAGGTPGALSPYRGWLVASLAVTQTVGYGVLYYAYAVFLTPMASALHTSTTVVASASCTTATGHAACRPGRSAACS